MPSTNAQQQLDCLLDDIGFEGVLAMLLNKLDPPAETSWGWQEARRLLTNARIYVRYASNTQKLPEPWKHSAVPGSLGAAPKPGAAPPGWRR